MGRLLCGGLCLLADPLVQPLPSEARVHLPDWCQEGVATRILSLQESGIPVPNHICVNRDDLAEGQDPEGFVETEDYVEVDGERWWLNVCCHCVPCSASLPSPVGGMHEQL